MNNSEHWKRKHLLTLKSLYSRYPYFADYFPYIEQLYKKDEVKLVPFCLDILMFLIKCLIPGKKIVIASEQGITDTEMLRRWLRKRGDYQLLIDSDELPYYQLHFSDKLFKVLNYPEINEFPVNYHPRISILVLLFLCGPETIQYFS